MEKSIESIWKNGFISEGELAAPVVNNLYERKSILVVDKLIGKMKTEFKALFPLALFTFLVNMLMNNGIIWSLLGVAPFVPWFFIAYRQIQSMKSVPTESNCLEYLKNVKKEVKRILKFNLTASIISIPVVGFPTILYTYLKQRKKNLGEIFGVNNWDMNALWLFMIIPIAMLLCYLLFKVIYKLTNKTELNLNQIIQDLLVLKNNTQ